MLATGKSLTKDGWKFSSRGTEEGGVGLVGKKLFGSEEVILTVGRCTRLALRGSCSEHLDGDVRGVSFVSVLMVDEGGRIAA